MAWLEAGVSLPGMNIFHNKEVYNMPISYINALKSVSVEVGARSDLDRGFSLYKFNPDIKMRISYRKEEYHEWHPSNYHKTCFIFDQLYVNEILTFSCGNYNDEAVAANRHKKMLSIVLELVSESGKDAIFIDQVGNEIFFYTDGVFYFGQRSFDMYTVKYPDRYQGILGQFQCVAFSGKQLR